MVSPFGAREEGREVLGADRGERLAREARGGLRKLAGPGLFARRQDPLVGVERRRLRGEDLVVADAAASKRRVDVAVVLAAVGARVEVACTVVAGALEQPP